MVQSACPCDRNGNQILRQFQTPVEILCGTHSMKKTIAGFCFFALLVFAIPARADLIEFVLTGNGGMGLLPENVTPPTDSMGSGGIGGSGIIFDTETSNLHVDVRWGSEYGYGDLTGPVTFLHLHGPTPDLPPDAFSETGPLILSLATSLSFDPSPDGGGVNDDFFIDASFVQSILEGRTYINVHTAMYDTGEIRGYLVPASSIPEPGASLLLVTLACAIAAVRRKK
jgi:hypothetical protein